MILNDLKKLKFPDQPGVYMFRRGRKVLYVGKAAVLKDRVRSYFNQAAIVDRGPKIVQLISEASGITWQETNSVLEALMLEAELIKRLKPKYNTRDKDDKSFWQIIITKETYPRVLSIRQRALATDWDPDDLSAVFGPFPQAGELKAAMKLMRQIFPWRDKCQPGSGRPCFNRQLGLCPGVCTNEISPADYRRSIGQLKLFLAGKSKTLRQTLKRQMTKAAQKKQFELAAILRDRLQALDHIQDVALLKRPTQATGDRLEAYDIAHLAGRGTVGGLAVVVDGQPAKNWYRRFIIKNQIDKINDPAHLAQIVSRRIKHTDWPRPDLVIVDGGRVQIKAVERILAQADLNWPVVGVVKDDRHQPKDIIDRAGQSLAAGGQLSPEQQTAILLAAAEVHRFTLNFHRKKRQI